MDPVALNKSAWPQVGLIKTFFPGLQQLPPPQGPYHVGTGTLVSPAMILTAAHNLFNWSLGGRTTALEVTFGGGQTVTSTTFDLVNEWTTTTTSDPDSMSPLSAFDCGAIFLDSASAAVLGNVTPAGVFRTSMDQIRGVPVTVVGYPSDPRRPDLFRELAGGTSPAQDVTNPALAYRVAYGTDSLEGMSGGPVYTLDGAGRMQIRAVNTSSYPSPTGEPMGNGLLIYPALAATIGDWVNAAARLA